MSETRFQVVWAESAVRDLEEIVSYVAAQSPAIARRLFRRIRKRADSLRTLPARGRIVPELGYFGIYAWREVVIAPYRLIYRIAEKKVFVLAFVDGRRDFEDFLLQRLLRVGESPSE